MDVSARKRPSLKRKVIQWVTYCGMAAGVLAGIRYGYDLYTGYLDYKAREEARLLQVKSDAAEKTLNKLYYSWETKDIKTYIDCWDPDAVQLCDWYSRDYKTIVAKRTEDFGKYKRVLVKFVHIKILDVDGDIVQALAIYTMHFEPLDGAPFNESYVKERYFLRWHKDTKQCKIIRNDAYLSGNPHLIGPKPPQQRDIEIEFDNSMGVVPREK